MVDNFQIQSLRDSYFSKFPTNLASAINALSITLTGSQTNNTSILLLIHLIDNFIGQCNNEGLVDEEGFFLTSYQDIEAYSGILESNAKNAIKLLEANNLIERTCKGGVRKALRIKLNINNIERLFNDAYDGWVSRITKFEEERREQAAERKDAYKSKKAKWTVINNEPVTIQNLVSKGIDEPTAKVMVTITDEYYNDRGKRFYWNDFAYNSIRCLLSGHTIKEPEKQTAGMKRIDLDKLRASCKLENIEKIAGKFYCPEFTKNNILGIINAYKNFNEIKNKDRFKGVTVAY